MKLVGCVSISRDAVLRNGVDAFKLFIRNFLISTRFNTQYGRQKVDELLRKNGIEPNDESVLRYAKTHTLPIFSLMVFQTGPDDYEFKLVNLSSYEQVWYYVDAIEQHQNLCPTGKLTQMENNNA